MIRILLWFLLVVFFASCNNIGPRLELEPIIRRDKKEIIIRNTGDKELIIEDFTTTCECTLLKIEKGERVKPNDSLVVPLLVKRPNSDSARKVTYISIRTNTTPAIKTISFIN